jgi:hypothetical protein
MLLQEILGAIKLPIFAAVEQAGMSCPLVASTVISYWTTPNAGIKKARIKA